MARAQMLDVWILEGNTVYKEVPYTVVIDWIQQGRLLEDDRVRKAGEGDWKPVGRIKGLAAYFPRHEPMDVDDRAEALAPVEMDFQWKHPRTEEDEDVDMIPLIDVSLVLLIFFMMITPTVSATSFIRTPHTEHGSVDPNPDVVWLGVSLSRDDAQRPVYSIGRGSEGPREGDRDLGTVEELMARFDALAAEKGRVEVIINAEEMVPAGTVRKLILELGLPSRRERVAEVHTGVSG